jgi:putative ABC transport system substrate-binding protein
MRRREFITLLGGAAITSPLVARAQQPLPVIGFLNGGSRDADAHLLVGFRRGLEEIGFVEHRNVSIDYHWAEGRNERMGALANDLVRRRVAVIVASPGSTALAAKRATADIPIVFGIGNDPVSAGLVASFNRPGGNATGVYFITAELAAKRIGMLRELAPAARRIAVLINSNVAGAGAEIARKEAESAAAAMGLEADILDATTSREIDNAFAAIAQRRAAALVVTPNAMFLSRRVQIVSLAMRDRLPAIYPQREFAEAGGLMAYGSDVAENYRRIGTYTGRILKGTKPADLPVEQSTRIEFIINLQTARALGIDVPVGLSARADKVIE